MKRSEYLETLEGTEIRLYDTNPVKLWDYEPSLGIVYIKDGKVMADGKVLDDNPDKATLKSLQDDQFYQEFGVHPSDKKGMKRMMKNMGF